MPIFAEDLAHPARMVPGCNRRRSSRQWYVFDFKLLERQLLMSYLRPPYADRASAGKRGEHADFERFELQHVSTYQHREPLESAAFALPGWFWDARGGFGNSIGGSTISTPVSRGAMRRFVRLQVPQVSTYGTSVGTSMTECIARGAARHQYGRYQRSFDHISSRSCRSNDERAREPKSGH